MDCERKWAGKEWEQTEWINISLSCNKIQQSAKQTSKIYNFLFCISTLPLLALVLDRLNMEIYLQRNGSNQPETRKAQTNQNQEEEML